MSFREQWLINQAHDYFMRDEIDLEELEIAVERILNGERGRILALGRFGKKAILSALADEIETKRRLQDDVAAAFAA